MATEFEAKILDIDPAKATAAILASGGTKIRAALMRRYVYDISHGDANRWIRLRDDGQNITLAVKRITSDEIDGTEEWEVKVDDFEITNTLLAQLGFFPKSYQENRRESFRIGNTRLEIDTWPMIPPYLEIEADTRDDVLHAAAKLGYREDQLTGENTTKVYARYQIDLTTILELKF